MFRRAYPIPVRPGQQFKLVPIGDIHFDTDECDKHRLQDLMDWISDEEKRGSVVRLCGLGDYLDFMSPSNRARYQAAELYETTRQTIEARVWDNIREFVTYVPQLRRMRRPRLYRVYLTHRLLGNLIEARRVAAYDEAQAIDYAVLWVRADAKDEGSELHRRGVDLLPREWRAEKVEEVPSLVPEDR